MDINMPVMNGIEATGLIRDIEASKRLSRSTIIAVTAQDTEKGILLGKLEEIGFDSMEGKPLSKKVFQELLNKYLKE